MRKRLFTTPETVQDQSETWLGLEHAATVEVTSKDKDFAIESSLSIGHGQGLACGQAGRSNNSILFR